MDALANLLKDKEEQFKDTKPSPAADIEISDPFLPETAPAPKPAASPSDSPALDTEAIRRGLYALKDQVESLLRLLDGQRPSRPTLPPPVLSEQRASSGERVLEGVFNGEKMIGPDGEEYHVPPNYASKSKLIEGDIMKLTITPTGSFIYKQIGPVERKRIIGALEWSEESRRWTVAAEGRRYKVLTASISFFRGKPGDQVVLLVPESGQSDWAAVENVISA